MKEFTLRKDSWHYMIASFDNQFAEYSTDICQYIRTFFIGLAKILILTTLLLFFTAYFLYGVGNIIGVLFYGYQLHPAAMVPPGVVLALVIVGCTAKLKDYLSNRPKIDREPGFVGLAYDKVKNKTCARINFE